MKVRKQLFSGTRLGRLLTRLSHLLSFPLGIFWLYFFSLIFIFTFLVPPFQKPDEQTHFLKAMALAEGQIQCRKDGGDGHYILPNSVVRFPDQMKVNDILQRPDTKFPIGVFKAGYPFRNDTSENTTFRFCIPPSLGYVPYTIGAWVSYPFDNLLITFYLMRIMGAIFFVVAAGVSAMIIPKRYRILLLFFCSIPMVIHQVTAITYDLMPYALGVVLFSYFCSLLDKQRISYREFFLFLIITVLFSVVKYGYYFVYLFPFLLISRLHIKKLHLLVISGISVIVMALCYFIFADNAHTALSYILQTQISPYIYVAVHYPLHFLQATRNAVFEDSGVLIQGFIGSFGWQDYNLSPVMTYLYAIMSGYVLYVTVRDDKKILSVLGVMSIFVVLIINFLLIFLIYYLTITPVAYYRVIGIQGRHFLIFMPFLIYALSQGFQYIRDSRAFQTLCIGAIALVFLLSIGLTVYNRYFYFGRSFANPDALQERITKGEIVPTTLKRIPVTKSISISSSYPVDGSKIGGFQLLVSNMRKVTTPYTYVLKDASCTKILGSGILDDIAGPRMSQLLGDNDFVYTQYVAVASVNEKSFCLQLNPLPVLGGTPLILFGNASGTPIVEYLSIIH